MPTYQSPGVYVEEVAAGARPLEASAPRSPPSSGWPRQARSTAPPWSATGPSSPRTSAASSRALPRPVRLRLLHERRRQLLRRADRAGPGAARTGAAGRGAEGARGRTQRPDRTVPCRPRSIRRPSRPSSASRSPTPAATTPDRTCSRLWSSATAKWSRSSTTGQPRPAASRTSPPWSTPLQAHPVEETASGPGRAARQRRDRARGTTGGRRTPSPRLSADDYVGDVADRTGFAGLEAVDEVTMLCVPDLMSAYQQGAIDLDTVQAVQLAMIAHCELMGDRIAILDPPPGLNAQQIKEWRVDKARYDSKYATLYWPWIKVMNPATGLLTFMPPSGHIAGIWGRNDDTRGVHKAPGQRGRPRRHRHRDQHHPQRARPAQPGRHQLHPGLPRSRHPGLGRPHPLLRPGVALPERPAALQLPGGEHPQRHQLGRLRAERRRPVGASIRRTIARSSSRSGARAPCSAHAGRGVLRQVRRGDQPGRGHRRRSGGLRDRGGPGQAGRVRHLPAGAVLRRHQPGQRVSPPDAAL